MNLFAFMIICLILAHCKIYTFLMLISNSLLIIIALVDNIVLSIADVLSLAVFFIFLIFANGNLKSLSSLILYLRLVCKFLGFSRQTNILS